jgi:hypothetical protein
MYFERDFDGDKPADNWDLIKSHSNKGETMRDDIKRWMPKDTEITEVKFGDQKAFNEAFSPIPEGHRRDEPVHPNYYKGNNKDGKAIEVFDIIDQFVDGDFYLGNVLKYVCRAGKKSKETKKQDLEKAMHYIMEAIKRCNKETSSPEENKKC